MPIEAPASNDLYRLIGLAPNSDHFKTIISNEHQPTVKNVSNYVYHAYKPLGVSLCFIPKDKNSNDLILDAIDIYNGETRDGFSQCKLSTDLPCGLRQDMQAHEIVAMLGEPDRKGGGGPSRIPCWIEYNFNNPDKDKESGILLQLHGFEWEDREMGWTSFVLY